MNRSIKRAIEEYKAIEKNKHGGRDSFSLSDMEQLKEISSENGVLSPYSVIYNALMAGYAIGYKSAQYDARKDRKKAI